jgi:hypothetical protein
MDWKNGPWGFRSCENQPVEFSFKKAVAQMFFHSSENRLNIGGRI